ncbi:MAG: flagellar biosynthetic protein FliO [Spirochaetaceae bacterium]|nr:flagellar biosynthetic protein FliO [Spirochaetaceae bacterium]
MIWGNPGRGKLKQLISFFAVLLLTGGIQNHIFSQTLDETATAAVDNIRETEREYLLGEDTPDPQRQDSASIWIIFRSLIVLVLAAAAIYGIVYLLKRKKTGDTPDDNYLKILARAPINIKTAAAVIAVGNKAWLIGLSDTNVSAIAEINDQETVDAMLLAYSERTSNSKKNTPLNFTSILRRFSGLSGGTARKPLDSENPPPANLQRNRERLKNL